MTISGRVEARMTIPTGGAAVSASHGGLASAVSLTVPAGNYYLTGAGGVSGLLDTLATNYLNWSAIGYPQSAAAMRVAVGNYGAWDVGYLCQETSGNLASTFGTPTPLTAAGSPTYSNPGPAAGSDLAIGLDSNTDAFSFGNTYNVTGTDDLAFAWVGYHATTPSGVMFGKYDGGTTTGYIVTTDGAGNVHLQTYDGAIDLGVVVAVPVGFWYVGMAVIDRSTGKGRIGVCTLSGSPTVSTEGTVDTTNLTNAQILALGASPWLTGFTTTTYISAFYVAHGASAATGLSANLSTALTSFKNAVSSTWSVATSTTTGLTTISNSFWASSINFTSTTLRDELGFVYEFDYPQSSAHIASMLGYGSWDAGYLCNESSGNLSSIFGTPATLTAAGSPTYSNYGPRGGSDKAIGLDSNTDAFQFGNVYDLTGTDDFAFAWVGYHATTPSGSLLAKYDGGVTTGYLITTDGLGTIYFQTYRPGPIDVTASVAVPVGAWYVGIATIDRSTGKQRIGVCRLGGSPTVSAEATITAATNTNGQILGLGATPWITGMSTTTYVAACYIAHGSATATGLSANLSTALSRFAAMTSQTSTEAAEGIWIPNCTINMDGDPAQAPRASDLRTTRGPTGNVLGLSGNSFREHTNIVWSAVPIQSTWESEADYANGSWEHFFETTQMGFGHSWFTPASPVQIYCHDGTVVGEAYNDGAGVSGWYITGVDKVNPKKTDKRWTGRWRIEIPQLISPG